MNIQEKLWMEIKEILEKDLLKRDKVITPIHSISTGDPLDPYDV